MGFVNNFRELPAPLLMLHVGAKSVGGIGIGVLLCNYLAGFGWWIILLAVLMAIPSTIKIFGKK